MGADPLRGGDDRDRLLGRVGNDTLEGSAGDNHLRGKAGADRLLLDHNLWSGRLTPAQVIPRFATDTGPDVGFDFGGGDVLLLRGVGSLAELKDDLVLF